MTLQNSSDFAKFKALFHKSAFLAENLCALKFYGDFVD